MAKIKSIDAQEILNSKGVPTIKTVVTLTNDRIGVSTCSTSKMTGPYEAFELKDGDQNKYSGQGVTKAVNNIKELIAPKLKGMEIEDLEKIDKAMINLDGTKNKSKLGANAIYTVSVAAAKAGAQSALIPLYIYLRQFMNKEQHRFSIPVPVYSFINGANTNGNYWDFAEYLVIPASSKRYLESVRIGEMIYKSLRKTVNLRYVKAQDYEDGRIPELTSNEGAFSLIQKAISDSLIKVGFDVFLGLNSRASTLLKNGKYSLKDKQSPLSSKELVDYYEELNRTVHMLYLEDALDEEDWDGWQGLFKRFSDTSMIVGGDLVSTNLDRLKMAIGRKTINAVTMKPNQIGTVTESVKFAKAVKEADLKLIVSHRANDTVDDFIADFSVTAYADYIKMGNFSTQESVSKYNRLLQIDNQLKVVV